MNDWTQTKENGYYRPIPRNFPGVDSIAIMKRIVFLPEDESGALCAVGWQSTVARVHGSKAAEDSYGIDHAGKHIVKRGTLRSQLKKRIREHIRNLMKDPNLPLYLVFATTPNGIDRAQKLAGSFQQGDKEFLQFVVRAYWFDEIQLKLGLHSPSQDEEEAVLAVSIGNAEDDE